MNHANSELAHGTSGSPQLTLENGEPEAKAKENEAALNSTCLGDLGDIV